MTNPADEEQSFKSARGMALLSAILFYISASLLLLLAGVLLASLPLLRTIESEEAFWETLVAVRSLPEGTSEAANLIGNMLIVWLEGLFDIATDVGYSALAIAGAGFVGLLAWTYRAHSNLKALGNERQRFSSIEVLWWLVPIMQLFRPYQLMDEVWRQSDPMSLREGGRRDPPRSMLVWWWALFVVSLLGWCAWGLVFGAIPGLVGDVSWFALMCVLIVLEVLLGVVCFLTALIVIAINNMQIGRSRLLAAARSRGER